MNIEELGVACRMKLRNKTNGIIGTFVREFRATGFGMIVIVQVPDGRLYRAPKAEWEPA